jgi:hypothetical protein
MPDNILNTCPIGGLLHKESGKPTRFRIPDYQRGYRWRKENVVALLDDLWDFFEEHENGTAKSTFYCLQPLVLAPSKDTNSDFDVVDGQQRLTTIFLILTYLKKTSVEAEPKLFDLTFATRNDDNSEFFKQIDQLKGAEDQKESMDIFHFREAYQSIQTWVDQKFADKQCVTEKLPDKQKAADFLACLLRNPKEDSDTPHAGVIWYELDSGENPIAAFTRLNIGKIRLTNDELIRALFLRRENEEDLDEANRQYRLAYEWDQMEKALQADDFWMFLSNELRPAHNRIGLLFDLIFETQASADEQRSEDPYRVFLFYNTKLKATNAPSPETLWQKIRDLFQLFEDWFLDHRLFHIIGFLVSQGTPLHEIHQLRTKSYSRSDFDQKLRQQIVEKLFSPGKVTTPAQDLSARIREKLDELDYPDGDIRSVLLLFNIATLLRHPDSNIRFQYDRFKAKDGKMNAWDVEHIRSATPPEKGKDRIHWLEQCLNHLPPAKEAKASEEDQKLLRELAVFCDPKAEPPSDETFDALFKKLLARIDRDGKDGAIPNDEATDNNIGNLTLLDAGTNRSYKNAFFAVKRQRILQLDREGTFLPLCTRNAFLKVYSPKSDHLLRWMPDDSAQHQENICETLVAFFEKERSPA